MTHPNIVVICSDQHRADALSGDGHPDCQTPNLDALAARGVLAERCFSQNPVCGPARAAMMTGCFSHRNGVPRNGYFCSRELPTMADLFAEAGYRTAAFGKLHLSPHQAGIAEAPHYGWQHLEGVEDNSLGPYFDWACEHFPDYRDYLTGSLFNVPENPDYWAGRHDLRPEIQAARERSVVPYQVSEACNWGYAQFSPLPEAAQKSTWITDRALAYLQNRQEESPFLMWVGYVDPHNPFDPPERFRTYDPEQVAPAYRREGEEADYPPHTRKLFDHYQSFSDSDWQTMRALYYGGVSFMDHQIGRLLDGIEAHCDMRQTIVIYLSDHGELLGDHGLVGKQAYHYDSCMRVPLICRWDGHWAAGERRDDLVEQTDLLPTLLEAAGLTEPVPMDGQSFAPMLAGDPLSNARGYTFTESYLGAPPDDSPDPVTWARTIRTDRYRVTFYPDLATGECFDLASDPHELHNRWTDPGCQAVIEDHRKLLMQRLILRDYPLTNRPYNV